MTPLETIATCFQGVVPSIMATCGRDGEPNVTYISQVYFVDATHVALSCQFFNKTRRNVSENPFATVVVYDPVSFESYKLRLRFVRAETEGPLFDVMADRIQAIASHTGMSGVFRLRSADVYDVLALEPVEGFLLPPDPVLDASPEAELPAGPLTEIRGLQVVSERINRSRDLPGLFAGTLEALDELLGFSHAMVFLPDDSGRGLRVVAERGYDGGGLGTRIEIGAGVVGTVAARRHMIRLVGVGTGLRYGRAIRGRVEECGDEARLAPELPLPGLPDAQAQLVMPLLAGDRLVGVLAVESRDPLCFDEWDEAFLQIVANQIALGVDRMRTARPVPRADLPTRSFVYFRNDDCVFVDGEYLVRNVPAKILWKVLGLHAREGRSEFTNRELRLDPTLGLPAVKDNLESRLILLRRRLAQKCPEVRLVPVRRGRFALELDARLRLEERDSA